MWIALVILLLFLCFGWGGYGYRSGGWGGAVPGGFFFLILLVVLLVLIFGGGTHPGP